MWKWQAEGSAKGVAVFIHSAYEEHRRYAWQIEKWRTNGFHVYMGDLPGHGSKAAEDGVHRERFFEYDETAAELLRLADGNALPIVLIGHGLGAAIAIQALAENRHTVSAAILSSPWLELKKVPDKSSIGLSGIGRLAGKGKIEHGIERHHLTRRKFQYETAETDPPIDSLSTRTWWKELQSYMERAAQVQIRDVPIMLHAGQRDLLTNTVAGRNWLSKQAVNEFHFKSWPHCFHDLFHEPEREEIFQRSLRFAQAAIKSEEARPEQ